MPPLLALTPRFWWQKWAFKSVTSNEVPKQNTLMIPQTAIDRLTFNAQRYMIPS